MTETTAITGLARWISGLRHEHIPPSIRQLASNCLVDTIGVAIAGSATEVAGMARATAVANAAPGAAVLIGNDAMLTAPAAAFVNASAAHALDFDDNSYAGFVHGSAVIAPAALAVAQQLNASGSDLLSAFIAGSECEYAIGAATNSVLYDQGWWTTGVLGPIGSCAATAWLLRLDQTQTASALGLAVAATGGLKACFGTDAKALMAGKAAEAGVMAALLAAQGASGPHDAFEHWNGFNSLFNHGEFDVAMLERLGSTWFMASPGVDLKRMPLCLASHAAVDAAMALQAQYQFEVTAIEEIVCDVPQVVIGNLIYDQPDTRQEAQFSMPFAIAVSLLYGSVTLKHLDPAILQEARLRELMARVKMTVGPRWSRAGVCEAAPEGANVTIKLRGRAEVEQFRSHARGAAQYPITQRELEDKFMQCSGAVVGSNAGRLLSQLKALDSVPAVRSLLTGIARDNSVSDALQQA